MRWTNWKILIYDNEFDPPNYKGPACYELGLGGKSVNPKNSVYVGETGNLYRRMNEHGSGRSHLNNILTESIYNNKLIYCRYIKFSTRSEAQILQNNLLDRYNYKWNDQLNSI